MKNSLYIIVFFGILSNGNAQTPCVANITNSDPNQAVCSDQWFPNNSTYYNTGVIKINMDYLVFNANFYTFSTVGETLGDTYLSLYDSNGTLLASNDDDVSCNCKQSTITYNPSDDEVNKKNFYIILSKPGCNPLDFAARIKYNVRNTSNTQPEITTPDKYSICGRTQLQFVGKNNITNTWISKDESIATIDKSTGLASFLKEGIAKIQLSGVLNCNIVNNYLVHITTTSTITAN
jgi:hypothetical protein